MEQQRKNTFPAQPHQNRQPGREAEMNPAPVYDNPAYQAGGKLSGKRTLITGGDSGIGRAVAVAYAKKARMSPLCIYRNQSKTIVVVSWLYL